VSLLIETNLSSGPASVDAWPKRLNGVAGTPPMPLLVNRSTSCRSKTSGNP
jgi:hypothetical protein